MSRFVRPDTKRLTISNGDWLLVKTRLSWGESRAAFTRTYIPNADGTLRHNPLNLGMAQVTAYLLDWNLTDDDGQPVVIRGVSTDELMAALDNLSPEDFTEIRAAIEAHEAAMAAEQEEKKRSTAGTRTSEPISPLPSTVTGPLSGSVN
jgi:hypothetical protein